MKKRTVLIGLLAAAGLQAKSLTWVSHADANGPKQYAVTDEVHTWHDAEALAESQGGHLVAINDAAENAWLVSTFGGSELFWIGLNDQALEGAFQWTNGDPFGYSNWLPGEPNDATNEEWVHMNWGGNPGGWNDFESGADYVNAAQGNTSYANDSFPTRGILERSAEVPEPGTWLAAAVVLGGAGLGLRRRGGIKAG